MRMILRPMIAVALSTMAWATALATFVCDLAYRIGSYITDAFFWPGVFIPRLQYARPLRRIWMAATALNDRLVGGVRIHGFLGRPTVRTLTG